MRLVMDLTSCTPGIWVMSAVLPDKIRTSVKWRKGLWGKGLCCAQRGREDLLAGLGTSVFLAC